MDRSSWYKKRKYLHFDQAIGFKKAFKIVSNPHEVASHSFYPFLSYKIKSRKIFKDSGSIRYKDKERPIAYAAHIDAHIYSYYCFLLTEMYELKINEENLNDVVIAFRKLGKSNISFAKEAFEEIRSRNECSAICFDISGFFDNLNHEQIKTSWCRLINLPRLPPDHFAVFQSLTRYANVDRNEVYSLLGISKNSPWKERNRICTPKEFREKIRRHNLISRNSTDKGIPQGSPMSAFLSNLYMLEFDRVMTKTVEAQGGKYYRYCDDMLFIIPSLQRDRLAGIVRTEIKKLKIDINPDKTEIRNFKEINGVLVSDKPLQYLGFVLNGNQVILRSAGLARYSERMKRGVNLAKKTRLKLNRKRISNGIKPTKLHRKKLYETYSHLGHRNFVRYGLRAANEMKSRSIRKQLKPLWGRLKKQIGAG